MGNRGLILAVIAAVVVAGAILLLRSGTDLAPTPGSAMEPPLDQTQSGDQPADETAVDVRERAAQPLADSEIEQPSSDSDESAATAGPQFGSDVPPDLVAEIDAFDDWETPAAAAARERIVAQGSAAAPGVLAALEDVVTALAAYDPANLGGEIDAYQALVMKLNHLLSVIGAIGDESHAEQLIEIGRGLNPDNMVTASFYAALDQVASPARSNEVAAAVIADPSSSRMQLVVAMSRYWLSTPLGIADSALQHVDNEMLLARAGAYKLVINAGRGDEIRERLIADVGGMQYTGTGNKQLLYAYALIEEPAAFAVRIEPLRLRRTVEQSATTFNRFTWSSPDEKLTQLPDLLSGRDPELHAAAVKFLLEEGRGDLLEEYSLARPAPNPFAKYESAVPGIQNMTHEQRLPYFDEELLARLEAAETAPRGIVYTATTAQVVKLLGYRLELDGDRVVVRSQ